jgi:cation transport ATPase
VERVKAEDAVRAEKAQRRRVAVWGGGVNDIPAMRKADLAISAKELPQNGNAARLTLESEDPALIPEALLEAKKAAKKHGLFLGLSIVFMAAALLLIFARFSL